MLNTASYALEATVAVSPAAPAGRVADAGRALRGHGARGHDQLHRGQCRDHALRAALRRRRTACSTLLWLLPDQRRRDELRAPGRRRRCGEDRATCACSAPSRRPAARSTATYARLRGRHLDLGRLQGLAASLPALTPAGQDRADVARADARAAGRRAREPVAARTASLAIAQARRALHVHRPAARPCPRRPCVRTACCAPPAWSVHDRGRRLRRGCEQRAALVVQDRLGAVRPFNEDDQRLLEAAAALIGGALDRGARPPAHARRGASRSR